MRSIVYRVLRNLGILDTDNQTLLISGGGSSGAEVPTSSNVTWGTLDGMSVVGQLVSKTGGTHGAWDAAAWGDEIVPVGGSFSFKFPLSVGAVGLGLQANVGGGYTQRYMVGRFNPGSEATLGVRDNDSDNLDIGVTATATDVLKLDVEAGGTVKLYKNGELIHTFAQSATGQVLRPVAGGWAQGDIVNEATFVQNIAEVTPVTIVNCTEASRDAIASPEAGMMVFNTSAGKLQVYTGSAWANLH